VLARPNAASRAWFGCRRWALLRGKPWFEALPVASAAVDAPTAYAVSAGDVVVPKSFAAPLTAQ
jgi:hypothetical protein